MENKAYKGIMWFLAGVVIILGLICFFELNPEMFKKKEQKQEIYILKEKVNNLYVMYEKFNYFQKDIDNISEIKINC